MQSRGLVLGGLLVIVIGLFLAVLGGGAPASAPSAAAPTPSTVLGPTPVADKLPAGFSCAPGSSQSIRSGGQGHAAALPLEALRATCGCAHTVTSHRPAKWQGHLLAHGLQLTGTCFLAVYRLNRQYDQIAGRFYVDDSTGTTGGIITLYDAVVPTDSSTYRALFEHNIGSEKDHKVSFQTGVRGVQYLAVWERCCTMQNTIFDVVATLTAGRHP